MCTVSVVVPNYNHARYLRKRIDSVLQQTYQDFELILLDDCSPDDSHAILSSYASDPRVRIEFNKENSGSTFKQWNKGVRMARGKYVWIAESDDYADARLLETLVGRLEAEPSAVLANCRSWRVSADGELHGFLDQFLSVLDEARWARDFTADGREECRKYMVRCNTVQNASSVVFRRDVYWHAGGADEKLVYSGDWKMWAAMALAGGTVAHSGEALNYYRFHDATVTAKSQKLGVEAAEWLIVVRWILEALKPEGHSCEGLYESLAFHWTPAVLDRRIPWHVRRSILDEARSIDPHALRRLVGPALTAFRLTMRRRYRNLRHRSASGDRAVAVGKMRNAVKR